MEAARHTGTRLGLARHTASHLGGIEGNEILTSAVAAVLTVLLAVEGITIIRIGSLLSLHMFLGLVLIGPLLLKLSSTGYRFVRYYTRTPSYLEKGPPLLALRLLAPLLVLSTVAVFATGVWLLLLGHKSDQVLLLHKVAFFIWGAVFLVHFFAYLPRMVRSLSVDWGSVRRRAVPGSGLRGMLVAASIGGGLTLALALLGTISAWHGVSG